MRRSHFGPPPAILWPPSSHWTVATMTTSWWTINPHPPPALALLQSQSLTTFCSSFLTATHSYHFSALTTSLWQDRPLRSPPLFLIKGLRHFLVTVVIMFTTCDSHIPDDQLPSLLPFSGQPVARLHRAPVPSQSLSYPLLIGTRDNISPAAISIFQQQAPPVRLVLVCPIGHICVPSLADLSASIPVYRPVCDRVQLTELTRTKSTQSNLAQLGTFNSSVYFCLFSSVF